MLPRSDAVRVADGLVVAHGILGRHLALEGPVRDGFARERALLRCNGLWWANTERGKSTKSGIDGIFYKKRLILRLGAAGHWDASLKCPIGDFPITVGFLCITYSGCNGVAGRIHKGQLIVMVADNLECPKAETAKAVPPGLNYIGEVLRENDRVTLTAFGAFDKQETPFGNSRRLRWPNVDQIYESGWYLRRVEAWQRLCAMVGFSIRAPC